MGRVAGATSKAGKSSRSPAVERSRRPGAGSPVSRRRRRWLALGGALLAILALAGLAWWARRAPPIPTVDLTDVPAEVRASIEAATAAIRRDPGSAAAWGELAMSYDAHGFATQAIASYAEAEARAPNEGRWPYLRALALRTVDRPAAVAAFDRALALGVDGLAVHYNFGNLLLDAGDVARAQGEVDRALASAPESAFALTAAGRVALMQGRVPESLVLLERALAQDSQLKETHLLLAQALQQAGRAEEGERHAAIGQARAGEELRGPPDPIFQAVVDRGVSSRWLKRRAEALFRDGRVAEAEALFNQMLAADGSDGGALIGLGVIRQRQGDLATAIDLYLRALALKPDAGAYSNLGWAKTQQGDLAGAEEAFRKALELAPGDVEASLNLALLRLRQGRATDAIGVAERVARTAPGDVRAHNTLAQALRADEQLAAAVERWRQSLDIDPNQPEARSQLAASLASLGEHDEAVATLREGLLLDADSLVLKGNLAWELATAPSEAQRDGAEALRLAEQIVQARPQEASSYDILAVAQAELGQFAAATASADKALSLLGAQATSAIGAELRGRGELYRHGQAYRQPR